MKAHILPLKGKYYGTIIEIDDDDMYQNQIKVWCFSGEPSARQLEYYGLNASDKGTDAWNDLFCDTHYETVRTYKLAQVIVDGINGMKED